MPIIEKFNAIYVSLKHTNENGSVIKTCRYFRIGQPRLIDRVKCMPSMGKVVMILTDHMGHLTGKHPKKLSGKIMIDNSNISEVYSNSKSEAENKNLVLLPSKADNGIMVRKVFTYAGKQSAFVFRSKMSVRDTRIRIFTNTLTFVSRYSFTI